MCRWAAYRGEPLFIEELVSSPAHSLIEQSVCATRAKTSTNADGFGIAWYGDRPEPGRFRDVLPAWSDCNLKSIARQIRSPLFLAHVRAATHGATRRDNCHPFVHGTWSFMHNGQIDHFDRLRRAMEGMLDDEYFNARTGSTDSELLFLLAMQFGMKQRPVAAMAEAVGFAERLSLELVGTARVRFTAAFSDGNTLYAVRYSTDAFAPTLYAGPMGTSGGHCLVSEPLTDDGDAWTEIPPGSAVMLNDKGLTVTVFQPQSKLDVAREASVGIAEMAG
ncbi:class II glutamine amidotransferase [Allorhizobium taibaishanense]|uniref:Glutamine amidotransferase n=1 Tax=Allorhizobium taibaishanense TaxID=887144 RepID=A0A1Q9A8Q6_9HYPH|nr:class II glutamine amidotransferase [Allorhizobium taibaishanense]MBB4009530.1 glutamine amidotransferase [Allorhizobium taibaishanense]OLP50937.1 class II glutamine amidotransferase [Allorhizobium taibaishanense]